MSYDAPLAAREGQTALARPGYAKRSLDWILFKASAVNVNAFGAFGCLCRNCCLEAGSIANRHSGFRCPYYNHSRGLVAGVFTARTPSAGVDQNLLSLFRCTGVRIRQHGFQSNLQFIENHLNMRREIRLKLLRSPVEIQCEKRYHLFHLNKNKFPHQLNQSVILRSQAQPPTHSDTWMTHYQPE